MSNQKTRSILLLVTDTESIGGISQFNKNLISSLSTYQLQILSLNDSPNNHTAGFNRNKMAFFISALGMMIKRPDVIIIGHLHFVSFAFVSCLLGINSIVILHGVEAWKPKVGIRRFLRFVNRFWSVSSFTKNKFLDSSNITPDKVDLIFNTLSNVWIPEVVDHINRKSILSIARLEQNERYKGLDITLQAVATLKEDLFLNGWQLDIVAHGSDLNRHKELASKLKINKNVNFHEHVDDASLKKLMSNCSFFILPSNGEGFGIVFLEAMAFRKAVIGASNCGSEDVIVNGKNGYLVEQNPEAIIDKIKYLTEHPEECKRMGEAGYDRFIKEFSQHKFDVLIQKLISECVE